MIKKNEEYLVEIIDNGFRGEGIAKIDGFTIFIPNAIKGEKVKIKILKVTTSHAFGKIISILESSKWREDVDCYTYQRCGGCNLRHMNYEQTIQIKKNAVESTLKKALGKEVVISEVIKMQKPYHYRNKLQYPVGINKEGQPIMGVFAERTHDIIPTNDCKIQNKLGQKIANAIYQFIVENNIEVYNEKTLEGSLRHIIIRIGIKTKEVMLILVSNTNQIPKEQALIQFITNKFPEIKTVIKNINCKNTNVILGNINEVLLGKGYIYDDLGAYRFKISPMSFYQINPIQTEKLYQKAIEFAELTGREIIFDLYCGIGTIGIFASQNAKKIYGIETIPEAIEDAKENAKLNGVKNAEFFVGDVEKTLPSLLKEYKLEPDVVFLDPPRKGCDRLTLETLLTIKPKKIVYVSCNPATLSRDVKILEEKYELNDLSICDMFPFTYHVECVAVLQLKENM